MCWAIWLQSQVELPFAFARAATAIADRAWPQLGWAGLGSITSQCNAHEHWTLRGQDRTGPSEERGAWGAYPTLAPQSSVDSIPALPKIWADSTLGNAALRTYLVYID